MTDREAVLGGKRPCKLRTCDFAQETRASRAMAVGFQWSLFSAVVLLSLHAAHSPPSAQKLSCVNDLVRSVTCTWRGPGFSPGSDCWLSGVKVTHDTLDLGKLKHSIRRCKVQQRGEFPGCTFSFNSTFNVYETMPNISVKCNDTMVGAHRNYFPRDHIKMHPPGAPNVSSSANLTRITWNPGTPRSIFIRSFRFQAQIKRVHQSWDDVKHEPTDVPEIVTWQKLKGHLQVRVRVKPARWDKSHWSNWSPVTSWTAHHGQTSQPEEVNPGQASLLLSLLIALSSGLFLASVIIFYRCCVRKRLMRVKTVPNPSKYFRTLHSVHGGNLKKWLNPVSLSNTFFASRSCEDISAVEVCETWAAAPASSPCSTSALLRPSSRDDRRSSCSSSCFSNMGYFVSSSDSSSSRTCAKPYFSYPDNVQSTHRKTSLSPPFTSLSIYESLRRELHSPLQSPDSGFGMGRFEDHDMEVMDDSQSSPLLFHLPLSVSSLPPEPPPFPSNVNMVFENQGLEEDAPTAASPAVSGNFSAWPVAEPMCRASSLPVDTSKSGYLTLKELQTTCSNKSI